MYEPTKQQHGVMERLMLSTGGVAVDCSPIRIDGEYVLRMVDKAGWNHWVRENGSERPISGPTRYE